METNNQNTQNETLAHWYKAILDAVPFPITVTDKDMNWTFVNKAVEVFLGKKLEDMVGKPCSNWGAHICNTENCGIACAKRGVKRTYFDQNGKSHLVDVEILKDSHNDLIGFVETVQDITEIKKMTEELRIVLLEAHEAYRIKTEFLSRMSHEMLTPMNAIIGMTQILKMKGIPDQTREYLDEIDKASRLLLRLVNDLLDISGKKDSSFSLADSVFSFKEMLGNILEEIGGDIAEKQQAFTFDIDRSIPDEVIGDKQRLAQVITNLLTNAVKFTPEHGEICLSACVSDEDNEMLTIKIEITDNGIGISEERQRDIFSIFEQADTSLTRKHRGVGLGLPVSKRIVEMMGGSIWVDSELGKGSKFTFTCKKKKSTS